MRILGIDPGIGRTGWGIIQMQSAILRQSSGQALKAQNYGCVETTKELEKEQRLKSIYGSITDIIEKYKPDVLAVEELFFNTNAKTAFAVGEARGVILLAGAEKKLPVFIYTPLQVKVALTGYGRAEKMQVGKMVQVLLKLKTIPKPDDVTDALAVALTHAFSKKFS